MKSVEGVNSSSWSVALGVADLPPERVRLASLRWVYHDQPQRRRAMTPPHCSQQPDPRTDPFRWPRAEAARAHDQFRQPEPLSQRQYAHHAGIPRSTLDYWLRRDDPAEADPQLHPE